MKKLSQIMRVGLALLIAVFSTQILPVASAYAASNNGTLKVHEKGTASGTESNDPTVCVFNFEAFGLDPNQSGTIVIETQSGTPITPVSVTMSTDVNGNGTSDYLNDTRSMVTIPNGHYKATLDSKFGTDNGDKAKSKVFKVSCNEQTSQVTPNITIIDECGTQNDGVTGTATTGIQYSVTQNGLVYTVTATAESNQFTLAQGNGFTLNRDGTATRQVTLTDNRCSQSVAPCREISGPTVITQKSQFADWNDDRSAGHTMFVDGGLRVWTDDNSGNAKVAWYHNVDIALSEIGTPAIDYTATSGIQPGLQIVIDFDGDGTPDGILVGESASYGNVWWLSNNSAQFVKNNAPHTGGGYGSNWYGNLNEWLTNFPTARVTSVGFSLGSGVHADGILHSLTFGCHKYEFDAPATPVRAVKPEVYDYCYNDQDYIYVGYTTGVTYRVNGEEASGWYKYEGTPLTVSAEAQRGYVLQDYDGPWVFDGASFSNQQCLTITKKVKSVADTNQNGSIGFGDTITWEITITNNSNEYYDTFYAEINDPGTTLETDGYVGIFSPGDSVTLTATSMITANDVQACKAVNTATLSGWRAVFDRQSEALLSEESDVPAPLVSTSASATYNFTCPPLGMGNVGQNPSSPSTPVPASPVVQELPHTGPAENNMLIIGTIVAIITYGAVYFAQPRRRYE